MQIWDSAGYTPECLPFHGFEMIETPFADHNIPQLQKLYGNKCLEDDSSSK